MKEQTQTTTRLRVSIVHECGDEHPAMNEWGSTWHRLPDQHEVLEKFKKMLDSFYAEAVK